MKDSLPRLQAEVLQALAHPTRVAIVEVLRSGEVTAGKLGETLGLEQANVSQHLSILRTKKIVTTRKVANQVFYSLRDPILTKVLDILRRYVRKQLTDARNILEEIGHEEGRK